MTRRLDTRIEAWPLEGAFRISRGAKTEARVVVAAIAEGPHSRTRRGGPLSLATTRRPKARAARSRAFATAIEERPRPRGPAGTPCRPGAARNALDCALWDLEAKRARGAPPGNSPGWRRPEPCVTAVTLSLDTPARMGRGRGPPRGASPCSSSRSRARATSTASARCARTHPMRTPDRGRERELDSCRCWTRTCRPSTPSASRWWSSRCRRQTTPRSRAGASRIPLCADESCHTSVDLPRLRKAATGFVNVKLDKTGGLTEALALAAEPPARWGSASWSAP